MSPRAAPAPERVGRYRVLGELGRGGMGVVYRAQDPRLGREVALKVLSDAFGRDAEAKARLLDEARAAATLDHPNVCTVYEVAETDDGQPFIALACYDGETLAERLARGPLAIAEAVRLVRGVAAGVAAAHAQGIVHRDLKPANVFVTDDGTPKVLDFGVAQVAGDAGASEGTSGGTLAYAAPEQAAGAADARSDVWALGLVLYEMLTGENPFLAPYAAAVRYNVHHEDPPPPSARVDVPPALDAVVLRALAKDPADRYPDAGAFALAIEAAVVPDRTVARLRPRYAVLAVALAALLVAAMWSVRPGGPFAREAVHLAVLAFEPESDAPDDRAFAEGLAETLASGVVEAVPTEAGLWVVPANVIRDLGVETARQADAVLGANRVLTGRLAREGGRLVLTLALTSTGDRPRTLASRTLTVAPGGTVRAAALQAVVEMLGLGGVATVDRGGVAWGTDDPEAQRFFLAGVGYLERDLEVADLNRAVGLFEDAIGEDPDFAAAHARLAEAAVASYNRTRDTTWIGRAQTSAARALALAPDAPHPHIALAHLRNATGDYPAAIAEARLALDLDPASAAALRALGEAQEGAGDPAAAEQTLLHALRLRPGLWTGHADLGYLYFRLGRLEDAAAQFEAIIALAPGNFQGYYGRAAFFQATGDEDAARRNYQAANAIRPNYGAYSNLGLLLYDAGDQRGAARMYRRALAMDSTDHVIWITFADLLDELGDQAGARQAYRRTRRRADAALAVNPADAYTRSIRASAALALGDRAAAIADAEQALREAPSDVRVSFRTALVFAETGSPARALDALTAAVVNGHKLDYIDTGRLFATARALPGWSALRAQAQADGP
ncbi:protein kinase domain-containing protein [Rubrivirga sp. IMCC45206]|uniref:protein kinase domain-containing protein n=1 Tax=Rubrivirga sp. IMCC45206 TaxID=3391614 RepID=UPI00398FA511